VLLTAGAASVHRRAEDRRHAWSGSAAWIWSERAGRTARPQRFSAACEVRLDAVPARLEVRFCVDPEYRLLVNGREIASGRCRPGDELARADLAPYLAPGANWVAIETGSADGIGGILFEAQGPPGLAEALASSARWRVAPDLETIERGGGSPAIVWGRPPQYPWGYPAGTGGRREPG
jgi:hypothetical protein